MGTTESEIVCTRQERIAELAGQEPKWFEEQIKPRLECGAFMVRYATKTHEYLNPGLTNRRRIGMLAACWCGRWYPDGYAGGRRTSCPISAQEKWHEGE